MVRAFWQATVRTKQACCTVLLHVHALLAKLSNVASSRLRVPSQDATTASLEKNKLLSCSITRGPP